MQESPALGSHTYDLVGLIEHQGTSMRSGHYYAYTRGTARLSESKTTELTNSTGASSQEGGQSLGQEEASQGERSLNGMPQVDSSLNGGGEASEIDRAAQEDTVVREDSTANPEGITSNGASEVSQEVEPNFRGSEVKANERSRGNSSEVHAQDKPVRSCPQRSEVDPARNEIWYKISDDSVYRSSLQQVLASEAYILLYARRSS